MGLKFERSNDLDKLFDSFAVDPLKKEVPLEELAKQRQEAKKKKQKNKQRVILLVFFYRNFSIAVQAASFPSFVSEEKIIKSSCLSKFKAF